MEQQTRSKINIIAIIIGVSLFIMGLMPKMLVFFGKQLTVEIPTNRCDMMIVLAGGRGDRVSLAADLYKKGVSKQILMSGGGALYLTHKTQMMTDYAVFKGVKKRDVYQEKWSRSTYENAKYTLEVAKKSRATSILIITSEFHTARSLRIFKKVYNDSGIALNIVGAEDGIVYNEWWKHHEMAEDVLIEWAKTIVYWIKY